MTASSTESPPGTEAARFVEGFADGWGRSDLDALLSLLTDEIVLKQPMLPTTRGKEAARKAFTRLFTAFPGLRGTVHDWVARDDVLYIHFTLSCDFGGRELSWPAVDRFVLRDGLALERINYFDSDARFRENSQTTTRMAEPRARTADPELQVSGNGAAPRATGSLPPGPRLPRFVQTLGFILPVPFIDTCRRRYGDLVTFGTLFDPCFVMVFDPENVKTLFRGSPHQLRAGEANAPLGPVVGQRSLLLLDGDQHLRERRLMLPAFHGERMRAYETVMREAADREIDGWPVGEPFTLMPSMQRLTLDVIMHAVFGVTDEARAQELKKRVRAMLDPFGTRIGLIALALSGGRIGNGGMRQFEQRRREVDELIFDEIARRREAPDLEQREDVFSMLLLARDEDGRAMTDQELRDELVTLLVAGHETTATGLAWTFRS